jgi:hypothetical protein
MSQKVMTSSIYIIISSLEYEFRFFFSFLSLVECHEQKPTEAKTSGREKSKKKKKTQKKKKKSKQLDSFSITCPLQKN